MRQILGNRPRTPRQFLLRGQRHIFLRPCAPRASSNYSPLIRPGVSDQNQIAENRAEGDRRQWRRRGSEAYSDAFQRLREKAGLRRIKLHALRNTSVSLMLDQRQPVHVVAGWHGHDPAVSLSIYADAKADEMRAAGASLSG